MANYKVTILTEYQYLVEDVNDEWEAIKVAVNDPDSTVMINDRSTNISAELIKENKK